MGDDARRATPTRREYLEFGAFDAERFPDVPEAQRLFDRERVADIVAGEF